MPDPRSEHSHEDLADEPVYVISVAAKLAGLPSWTLRILDKEGVVRPQRTAKDRRLYSDRDIARLARVRYLTEERGVNMNGVKMILEMEQELSYIRPAVDLTGETGSNDKETII